MLCSQKQGQLQQNISFLNIPFHFKKIKIIKYWIFLVRSYKALEPKHFLLMLIETSLLYHDLLFKQKAALGSQAFKRFFQSNNAQHAQAMSGCVWSCTPVILISRKLGLQRFQLCSHCTKVFTSLLTFLWY